MIWRLVFILALLALPVRAAASDWLRAETENFVLYGDLEEAEITALAQRLEAFRLLMQRQFPQQLEPARKHHVFLDDDDGRITYVAGQPLSGLTRLRSEIDTTFAMYDPDRDIRYRDSSVFFAAASVHLNHAFVRRLPPWLNVGLPAFFGTTILQEAGEEAQDNVFLLGVPDFTRPSDGKFSEIRFRSVLQEEDLPVGDRLYGEFYRMSRELVRALLSDASNDARVQNYLALYAKGGTLDQAAAELGDLQAHATEARRLYRGAEKGRVSLRQVPVRFDEPVQVSVRTMEDDQIALVVPRLRRLENRDVEDVAGDLENLTRRFPNSANVWYEYAAAEFALTESGRYGPDLMLGGYGFQNGVIVVTGRTYSDEKAWQAVNRALELDPALHPALRLKAELMLARQLRSGELDDDAGFDAIRELLAPIAADAGQEPLAAAIYYQTFIEQGLEPTDRAFDQLGRAFVGNAGVSDLRYAYAVALVRRGELEAALRLLESMLNDPARREAAQRALDLAS